MATKPSPLPGAPPAAEAPEAPPPALPPVVSMVTTLPPPGGYEAGFPKVYFSVYEQRPPIVVKTSEQEARIDRKTWMTIPPQEPPAGAEPKFPKVYENINSPVKIVGTPEDESEIGPGWREVRVPEHK